MPVTARPDGTLAFEEPLPRGQKCEGCGFAGWFGLVVRCRHPERSCLARGCERKWAVLGQPLPVAPVPLEEYATAWFDALALERHRSLPREEGLETFVPAPGTFALETRTRRAA